MVCVVGTLGLSGCRHKAVQPIVLPQATPVPLDTTAATSGLPGVEEQKATMPPVPVAEAATVPKQKKKRATKAQGTTAANGSGAPAAPVQVSQVQGGQLSQAAAQGPAPEPPAPAPAPRIASSGEAAASSVIGELTPGGDQNPRAQQEATDLIAANERRMSGLSPDIVKSQAALLSKVRNFQKQAQQALKAGDPEGAKMLATKGKLLLDDLTDPSGQ